MDAVWHVGKRFLLRCANEHNDFRISEITSLATIFNLKLNWIQKSDTEPYVVVDVGSEEDIKKMMTRTLLIRSAYELWGVGNNYQELHSQLQAIPHASLKPFVNRSFNIKVETYCKTVSLEYKIKRIEEFEYLPLEGPIKLENPEVHLALFEFYGVNPNNIPVNPCRIYFGRWLCDGQRDKISWLTLKKRKFIGNTSMDAQLSMIMANQALVKPYSFVYDPFVGTGSLLVAAAHFGGIVWGSDIDYLMLHGKAKPTRFQQKQRDVDESIAANLQQYNLRDKYMDVIVSDSSKTLWRDGFLFDALITDPPYGIRESVERIGTTRSYKISEQHLESHIPSKVHYSMKDLYGDLLNFAARHLKIGGRLVYWLPVFLEDYTEECVPTHPCFELIGNSEQPLTKHTSRRLITMAKIKNPQDTENAVAEVSDKIANFAKQYFKTVLDNRNNTRIKKCNSQTT